MEEPSELDEEELSNGVLTAELEGFSESERWEEIVRREEQEKRVEGDEGLRFKRQLWEVEGGRNWIARKKQAKKGFDEQ